MKDRDIVKNNFDINSYTGHHEFGCIHCDHLIKADNWPDMEKLTKCKKHGKKMLFLLNEEGFFHHEEWFCRDVTGKSCPDFHRRKFNLIKDKLKPDHMYLFGSEYIREYSFDELEMLD